MKLLKKDTMVAVHWVDAWHTEYDDEDMRPADRLVMGHVVKHEKQGLKIAMERGLVDTYRNLVFLPTPFITKISTLKIGDG